MTRHILALRLSRRAIGAVMVGDDDLTLCDGRHLASRRAAAVAAAQRYVAKLLDVSAIDGVVIDAPVKEGSQTTAVAAAVRALLAERGITVRLLATSDLLRTYTHPGLHHRSELRRIVETFWASLPTAVGRTRAVVLEAAAAALYDQTMGALNASPT